MTATALDVRPTEARSATREHWTVDPERSTVEFEVRHFWGLHTVRGRFTRFDGSYTVGPAGPEIQLTVDAGSVDTGVATRDRHLQAEHFFHADAHPQVTFRSTSVLAAGTGRVHVRGGVTAAGTTVPVAFDASVRLIGDELEVEATTELDPADFGMSRGPLRNILVPVELHVRAHVVPEPPA